ncbi:30S ribosomal protein S16 [Ekhidna sp.]|uniref:30S ribosomal protein S16 n=1 Tax=Ekhidna sp. TaxID=2608089 RepID=UPI0035146045
MPVKIRLARRGRKKQAMYDVVVADSRAPRDGRFIEKIGTYNPNTDPATIDLDNDKAFDWVMKGAQATDTVRAMLSYRGIMMKKHLQIGVNKGAITQEEADKKLEAWMKDKESKIQGKVDKLAKEKAAKKKAALEAEKKVSDARAEELKKKAQEAEAALVEEIKEGGAEGDEDVAEDVAEVEEAQAAVEAPAEEAQAEEPKAEAKEETPAEEAKEEDKKEG